MNKTSKAEIAEPRYVKFSEIKCGHNFTRVIGGLWVKTNNEFATCMGGDKEGARMISQNEMVVAR